VAFFAATLTTSLDVVILLGSKATSLHPILPNHWISR
jgi:hypothetical protein